MPERQPNDNVKLVKVSKAKRKSLSSKDTFVYDQHVDESGRLSRSGGKCPCMGRQTDKQEPRVQMLEGLSA